MIPSMARPQKYDSNTLATRALNTFWNEGYTATSIDDLVRTTGVSRHGIYKEFGGKKGMFLKSFDLYQTAVVSPAFQQVESPSATINDIAAYFEHQITSAEQNGLPGPGCFVANSATEVAPHDVDVRAKIDAHHNRLRKGFAQALQNASGNNADQSALAEAIVIFATGLWSISRVTNDGDQLRKTVASFLDMLKGQIS